jgi:hypothetical protein
MSRFFALFVRSPLGACLVLVSALSCGGAPFAAVDDAGVLEAGVAGMDVSARAGDSMPLGVWRASADAADAVSKLSDGAAMEMEAGRGGMDGNGDGGSALTADSGCWTVCVVDQGSGLTEYPCEYPCPVDP